MNNIIVVASITVKSEYKEEVYNELLKLHTATHKFDAGCIQYDLHTDLENKNSFTFVETWENKQALIDHENKEHFISFVAAIENKIEDLQINKLDKII